jgi:hypothetical protein
MKHSWTFAFEKGYFYVDIKNVIIIIIIIIIIITWSRVLLGKLIVAQLVKKFLAFYGK